MAARSVLLVMYLLLVSSLANHSSIRLLVSKKEKEKLINLDNSKSVNKNIIDVIDPFPDIFDNFDSLFIYFF